MRVLVIGGAGFLGLRVANLLSAQGHVVGICDSFSGSPRGGVPSHFRCYEGNAVSTNIMRSVFESFKPEAIFMSVAYHHPRDIVYKFSEDTALIIESAIALSGLLNSDIEHVYFFSSSEVYGDSPSSRGWKETTKIVRSASHHGTAKLAAERLLEFRCVELGIPYTVLRIFDLYGPRTAFTPRSDMVNFMAEAFLIGEPVGVVGATKKRDFIHVDDAARAISAIAAIGARGVFNIGTGVGTTPRSVYRGLMGLIPNVPRPYEVKGRVAECALVADTTRLHNLMGPEWVLEHDIISDLPELVEFRISCFPPALRGTVV